MIPFIPLAAGDILTDKKENWKVLSALFTESGEGGARKGWDVNARGEKKAQNTMTSSGKVELRLPDTPEEWDILGLYVTLYCHGRT